MSCSTQSSNSLSTADEFVARHIGIAPEDEARMLAVVSVATRAALIDAVVPKAIRRTQAMNLPAPLSEADALSELRSMAGMNQVARNFIGQGYYGSHTPAVILRNVLQNPAWYTAYTPYQAEISQGRLEALLNFQTMVCDLTGMAVANASMLDEATAAAEAMTLARRSSKSKSPVFLVAGDCHPQTIDVLRTRAAPLGIEIKLSTHSDTLDTLMAQGGY
ncbi:MAG: glycine dehydrogenase (aminomethyl-transferring), partial [Variovorax sp.]